MIREDADIVIIGAGIAGLTAAQYGARANVRTLAIEGLSIGGQALNIDYLENYPGLFPPKPGAEFADCLHRQAEEFGARFLLDSVTALEKEGDFFRITLRSGGVISAGAAIIATGTKRRTLGIPGEAEFYGRGVSYCATCDGPFFKNKRIFVIGGGDAACDEARFLARLSSNVEIIHRRDVLRAQKALAQRTLENPHIKVHFNTIIEEIRGDGTVKSAILRDALTGKTREEEVSGVFIFAGTLPQLEFLKAGALDGGPSVRPQRDREGYIIAGGGMETSVPGLFVAGDIRSGAFRQAAVAAGDGATAAHGAVAYLEGLEKPAGKV